MILFLFTIIFFTLNAVELKQNSVTTKIYFIMETKHTRLYLPLSLFLRNRCSYQTQFRQISNIPILTIQTLNKIDYDSDIPTPEPFGKNLEE